LRGDISELSTRTKQLEVAVNQSSHRTRICSDKAPENWDKLILTVQQCLKVFKGSFGYCWDTERLQEALIENLIKNVPTLTVTEATTYITSFKADIRQVYAQKKTYLVHKIRSTFENVYTEMLLDLDNAKTTYIASEEKWDKLCSLLELTTPSDKAFAKLIIELYCESKHLNSISETEMMQRYTYLLSGKRITETVLPSNKRKRSKPKVFRRPSRGQSSKKQKLNLVESHKIYIA